MTPEPSTRRRSFAAPFIASTDSYGPAKATRRTPGATSSALVASSPDFGSPLPEAPARSRRFASRSSSWSARIRSGRISAVWAPAASVAAASASTRDRRYASAPAPVSASIRRMPDPMLRSPVITKLPTWPDARQCVPPHSSWLKPSTRTVRTVSPYFSSKNASAPASIACCIVMNDGVTARSSRMTARTSSSIARSSSVVSARSNGKSKRR